MEHEIFLKEDVKFSGFWMRFLASLFDSIIVSIVSFIPAIIIGFIVGVFGAFVDNETVSIILGGFIYLTIVAANVCYYAGFHASKFQATPGKMLLGIKVVDIHGNRISFWRGVGRFFAILLSTFTLYIGFIMAGVHSQKRSLHDIVAGTYVINSNGIVAKETTYAE